MRKITAVAALLLIAGTAFAADPPDAKPSSSAVLKAITEYGKQYPDDTAGLRDRCLDARAKLAPDTYEHAVLTKRIADLDKVVDAAYRAIRPTEGAAKAANAAEMRKLALVLLRDLRGRSVEVKKTAILYLGRLGSETGVFALVRELARAKDAGVRGALVTALGRIGGPTTGRRLGEKLTSAPVPAQSAALDVLSGLVRASDEEVSKPASRAIGEFIFSRDPGIAERSIRILAGAGEAGVWGLERGSETQDHQLKLLVIAALGDTGAGQAAAICARFLDHSRGWRSGRSEASAAARAAIVSIGRPAVPYLSSCLLDSRRRRAARGCLYAITGRYFARPDEVAAWWSPHLRRKAKQ